MGDNGAEQKQEAQEVKLTITMKVDGGIGVEGPLHNEPLALWLLDKAKDTIKMFNIEKSRPHVLPAKGGMLDFARRFKR